MKTIPFDEIRKKALENPAVREEYYSLRLDEILERLETLLSKNDKS